MKLLIRRMRPTWPNVRITLRGDIGFCRWRLMRWCDRYDLRYIFGLARNSVLELIAAPLTATLEECHQRDDRSYRTYDVCHYGAQSWDRPRRVIIKAEYLGGNHPKTNPRFVVTNLPGDPQELYEQVYCQRGEMENRIKEPLFTGNIAISTGNDRCLSGPGSRWQCGEHGQSGVRHQSMAAIKPAGRSRESRVTLPTRATRERWARMTRDFLLQLESVAARRLFQLLPWP